MTPSNNNAGNNKGRIDPNKTTDNGDDDVIDKSNYYYFAFFSKLNMKLRVFLDTNRKFPHDLEECLQNMRAGTATKKTIDDDAVVSYFLHQLPYDHWQERFGHPTLSLIHFFKRPDVIFPPHVFKTAIEATYYVRMLFTVLLCPLERCLHVETYVYPELFEHWNCPTCIKNPKHECEPYMRALIAVISVLQLAIAVTKLNNSYRAERIAFAHLDAFMPLINSLTENSCKNSNFLKLMQRYPISLEWSMTEECVPDISPLITLSVVSHKMHGPTNDKKVVESKMRVLNKAEIELVNILIKIIYKGMPNRCHNRDLWNFMRAAVGFDTKKRPRKNAAANPPKTKHPNESASESNMCMMLFFFSIIIASLLGVYEFSRDKMSNVWTRAKIYRLMTIIRDLQMNEEVELKKQMKMICEGLFVNENKLVLLSIFREYVSFLVEKTPGISDAFKKVYNWKDHIYHVTTMSRIIRKDAAAYIATINNPFFGLYGMGWFARVLYGIDHKLPNLYESSRNCQKEKTLNYNINAIVKLCENMNLMKYHNSNKHAKLGKEFELENPHPQLDKDVAQTMSDVISTFSKNMWIPMDWLICFGVPKKDLIYLKTAVFQKSTQLMAYLSSMYTKRQNVYKVVYNFFKLSQKHKEYKEYNAPARMYMAHCVALNHYHEINGHIPPVLGKMQICPKCGDIKKPSFFRALKKNKNGGGLAIVRVCLDGRMVCGRKPKNASWVTKRNSHISKGRRTDSDDEDDDDDDDDDEEEDELEDGYYEDEDDDDDEPEEEDEEEEEEEEEEEMQEDQPKDDLIFSTKKHVPASNHSKYTSDRKNAKHVATQHVLNECQDAQTITINTLGKIAVWKQDEWIGCMRCLRPILLLTALDVSGEKICKDCFLCKRIENDKDPSIPVLQQQQQQQQALPRCEAGACSSRLRTLEDCCYLLIYDDLAVPPAKKQFRNMILCPHHSKFNWFYDLKIILPLSTVIKGFSEKWGTCNGPRGTYVQIPEFKDL